MHWDALAICFAFNKLSRLAEAFGFFLPGPKAFEAGAKYPLARGLPLISATHAETAPLQRVHEPDRTRMAHPSR
jgi:hypothetical protein